VFDDPALGARRLSLRPAREEDTPFLRALFETSRPDAAILAAWPEAVRGPFLDQQFHFQTIHYARMYPDADRLVVVAGGSAIGRMIVSRQPAEWCLVDIALLPDWRGQGCGTALVRTVQAAACRARAACVRLTVDFQNPARRLYQRLGFVTAEEGIPAVAMSWSTGAVN
jgi:ribosomal protein S18 acetylase RimI-like enzyme